MKWLQVILSVAIAGCMGAPTATGDPGPSEVAAAGSSAAGPQGAPGEPDEGTDGDAQPRSPSVGGLLLGGCTREVDGADCRGAADELVRYRSLGDDGEMQAVVGPQAAIMLVFLVRAAGIEPGDPEQPASTDNPALELVLRDTAGTEIARYRGRSAFVPSDDPDMLEVSSSVFLVIDGKLDQVSGNDLIVEGYLEDRSGERRDGQVSIAVAEW